jgi:hypothetical protein
MNHSSQNWGVVVSVRGSVVDVRFDTRFPLIYSLLRTGQDGCIAIDVFGTLSTVKRRRQMSNGAASIARPLRWHVVPLNLTYLKIEPESFCHRELVVFVIALIAAHPVASLVLGAVERLIGLV